MTNERSEQASGQLFHTVHLYRTFSSIASWKKMASTFNESQLQLVLQAFERDPQLNINEAIRLYNIPRTTLSARIKGRSIHINTIINSRKLTVLKEEVVVQEVFDLDSWGFPLRMRDIEDMANRLLMIHDATCRTALGFQLRQTTTRAPYTLESSVRLSKSPMQRPRDNWSLISAFSKYDC